MAPIINLALGGLDFDGVCRDALAIDPEPHYHSTNSAAQLTFALFFIPHGLLHGRTEIDVLVKLVFLREVLEVLQNLWCAGVEIGPFWIGFERERVCMSTLEFCNSSGEVLTRRKRILGNGFRTTFRRHLDSCCCRSNELQNHMLG